jgi:hypothetical protein
MKKKLILFESPGHGWLRVPLKDLDDLGIRDRVTGFSYIDGEFAYLEEGVDMPVYLEAVNLARDDIDYFDPCEVLIWDFAKRGINLN